MIKKYNNAPVTYETISQKSDVLYHKNKGAIYSQHIEANKDISNVNLNVWFCFLPLIISRILTYPKKTPPPIKSFK